MGIDMKIFGDQNKALYPHPMQRRKGGMTVLGLACVMFHFAADVCFNEIDPCGASSDTRCKLASFWSQTIGIPAI